MEAESVLKIDEIDAKILKDLLTNSRKSFQAIANECNVSRNAIRKHFKDLEKEGVISGSTIQVNYKKFGFEAVGTINLVVDPKETGQVVAQIQKTPNIYRAFQMSGEHSIGAIIQLSTIAELDRVKGQMMRFRGVLDAKSYIWIYVRNRPENLSISPGLEIKPKQNKGTVVNLFDVGENIFPPKRWAGGKEIGQIELEIIDRLSKNSRVPFRKIAQEIGVTPDTIIRKYKNLEENGMIRCVIQLDLAKMGYSAGVSIAINGDRETDLLEAAKALSEIPDVSMVNYLYGDISLVVNAYLRDIDQQLDLQERIMKIPNLTILSSTIYRLANVWPGRLEVASTF